MSTLRFTLTAHNTEQPWIAGDTQHLTVELPDAAAFAAWAADRWPPDRFTAELEPGQEPRRLCY